MSRMQRKLFVGDVDAGGQRANWVTVPSTRGGEGDGAQAARLGGQNVHGWVPRCNSVGTAGVVQAARRFLIWRVGAIWRGVRPTRCGP